MSYIPTIVGEEKMNSIIEKIWEGKFDLSDCLNLENEEYQTKERLLYEKITNFEEALDEKQKKEFLNIIKNMESFITVSEKQAFVAGYSVASCLTSEAFLRLKT